MIVLYSVCITDLEVIGSFWEVTGEVKNEVLIEAMATDRSHVTIWHFLEVLKLLSLAQSLSAIASG